MAEKPEENLSVLVYIVTQQGKKLDRILSFMDDQKGRTSKLEFITGLNTERLDELEDLVRSTPAKSGSSPQQFAKEHAPLAALIIFSLVEIIKMLVVNGQTP